MSCRFQHFGRELRADAWSSVRGRTLKFPQIMFPKLVVVGDSQINEPRFRKRVRSHLKSRPSVSRHFFVATGAGVAIYAVCVVFEQFW